MEICKKCGGIAEWNSYFGGITCTRCGYTEKPKSTNYDRLINKTPEELAKWIARQTTAAGKIVPEAEYKWWLDWLQQEVTIGD